MEQIPNLIQFIKFLIKITLICIIIHYLIKIIKHQIKKYKENNYILIYSNHYNIKKYFSKKTFRKFLNSNDLNPNFYKRLYLNEEYFSLDSFMWTFIYDIYNKNNLQIGCKCKSFEFWDEFFSNESQIEYETPRNSYKFKYLKKTYELCKKEIEKHEKFM